ncbi:hypothetical protein KC316_g2531 [Hortaea werneckii]|nr:hypothetical protein KC324_g724 [Hortaea werneckii]KAI7592037.1 hypothetical protein KC316_g2531 [Hortaea werneckii]
MMRNYRVIATLSSLLCCVRVRRAGDDDAAAATTTTNTTTAAAAAGNIPLVPRTTAAHAAPAAPAVAEEDVGEVLGLEEPDAELSAVIAAGDAAQARRGH